MNDRDKRAHRPSGQGTRHAWLQDRRHARHLRRFPRAGVPCDAVFKVNEGRPNIVDLVKTGKIDLVINTPLGRESFYDEKSIRRAAIRYNIPCITTLSAAQAAVRGIHSLHELQREVNCLQDLHNSGVATAGTSNSGD